MSTETKWTPGPWRSVIAQRGFIVVSHDATYDIAVVRDIGNENNEANATLIAAAPELYKTLDELLGYFRSSNAVDVERATIKANAPEVLAARAALKKARGE